MKRYIIKSTPSAFYFEEMNHRMQCDGDILSFALPPNPYQIGDMFTIDYCASYNFRWNKNTKERERYPIYRTYKIVNILYPGEEESCTAKTFGIFDAGLVPVEAYFFDHTRLSEKEQKKITVVEVN